MRIIILFFKVIFDLWYKKPFMKNSIHLHKVN